MANLDFFKHDLANNIRIFSSTCSSTELEGKLDSSLCMHMKSDECRTESDRTKSNRLLRLVSQCIHHKSTFK